MNINTSIIQFNSLLYMWRVKCYKARPVTDSTKQWEVPTIAGRNTKANTLQKWSAGFKATIDLNKKSASRWCIHLRKECRLNFSKVSVYIWNIRGKNDKNRWMQTSAGCAQAGISQSDWVPNYRGIFQFGPD
jgi:hypothetical protein